KCGFTVCMPIPALLTSTSMPPSLVSTRSTPAAPDRSSRTSRTSPAPWPPRAIRVTASWTRGSARPVRATRAPASARAWLMAEARPLVSPVTSARIPLRSGDGSVTPPTLPPLVLQHRGQAERRIQPVDDECVDPGDAGFGHGQDLNLVEPVRVAVPAAVDAQGSLAVRPRWRKAERAAAGEARGQELADGVPAQEPLAERRHLQQRVLAQGSLERLDVHRRERGRVAVQQVPGHLVRRLDQACTVRRRRRRRELGARSLERAVDRGD